MSLLDEVPGADTAVFEAKKRARLSLLAVVVFVFGLAWGWVARKMWDAPEPKS